MSASLNWKFVKLPASRGKIMFMLCLGDRLIMELSQLKTKKVKGHTVTEGTTSAPFEYAMMIEGWIEKSGVKIEPPSIADYAKTMNHNHQMSFIKPDQTPSVPVVIISLTDWKRNQRELAEKEKKS